MNTQTLCLLNLESLNYMILSSIITQYLCMIFIMTVCQKHLIHPFSLLNKDITIIPDLLQDRRTPFPILELIMENSTSDILV